MLTQIYIHRNYIVYMLLFLIDSFTYYIYIYIQHIYITIYIYKHIKPPLPDLTFQRYLVYLAESAYGLQRSQLGAELPSQRRFQEVLLAYHEYGGWKKSCDRWFIPLLIGFQPSFWRCRISLAHPQYQPISINFSKLLSTAMA